MSHNIHGKRLKIQCSLYMHMHMDMDISRTSRLLDTLLRQCFTINARPSSSCIAALVITLNILGHWHPHY